ncbi:maleylpyruvate isomerase family mycothiol-dependent enzyme [Kutzneria buriramensis]|uniref:Uncharacterized protein (TIGR03083 family) n=1 Tax=Kutzneria buriramensis TaxID=1045776 RepID=A0A3E0H7U4_9PSEU|nr:maleylpyruvate isomerase family mycothiol-dependent enzyme [Kutzneria buriramensis]REH39174.1 uncharacterized protein (TIGR03083 family) [Kutzneria buriramensis]
MNYATELLDQSDLFGSLIRGADLRGGVPTCPEWTFGQLAEHVGRGHRWAARIVRDGSYLDAGTIPDGVLPADTAEAVRWPWEGARILLDAVADAGLDTPVWTVLGPRPARWWVRRRLHETIVHRADATLARGLRFDVRPELAADAIDEWLGNAADEVFEEPLPLAMGVTMAVRITDAPHEWAVTGEAGGLWVRTGHRAGDLTVSGRAVDVLLALVRRLPADRAGVRVEGDPALWERWLAGTPL